ncbi:PEP-utilizing enzyme [Alphaproteobacteria bacterium]|nr:PEP-utilizing enzyme [Alphaproteobacteria bacterium]
MNSVIDESLLFKSKGKTLIYLGKKLSNATVPKLLLFKCTDLTNGKMAQVIELVVQTFKNKTIIVRSSSSHEDKTDSSGAGEFLSIRLTADWCERDLQNSMFQIIDSYKEKLGTKNIEEQEIIVQQLVENVSLSGVVFTKEMNFGAPYIVINYDDVSGSTCSVTSGTGVHANKNLYIHRQHLEALRSSRFIKLVLVIKELEILCKNNNLDIEFAVDWDGHVYVLQVRPITTSHYWSSKLEVNIDSELIGIQSFLDSKFQPAPNLYGKTALYGQMPDWNPAEIIGKAPKQLAFSLYKYLITDRVWSEARMEMGYNAPINTPLVSSIGGQPYVDVRISLNSFLPKGLNPRLAENLVNIWLEILRKNPALHDKIEFDVAITSYTFDIQAKLAAPCYEENIKSVEKDEFIKLLKKMTIDFVLGNGSASINSAMDKIYHLEETQSQFGGKLNENHLPILLRECIDFGTRPFSILARHAFVARDILLSLVNVKALKRSEMDLFLASVRTVASDFTSDMDLVRLNQLTKADFLEKYGHLRPGTYDITSKKYNENAMIFEGFEGRTFNKLDPTSENNFCLSKNTHLNVNKILKQHGFEGINSVDLFQYCRLAIANREYSKFIFTRSLSKILDIIGEFGNRLGFDPHSVSNMDLFSILDLQHNSVRGGYKRKLEQEIAHNRERHEATLALKLPQLISDVESIYIVPYQTSEPNFITNRTTIGATACLSGGDSTTELDQKIVLIENADPGFDWIFSHNIAGLITKFGGVNSHMAIRCLEFGIPAAIGCGEVFYETIKDMGRVKIDCSARLISGE